MITVGVLVFVASCVWLFLLFLTLLFFQSFKHMSLILSVVYHPLLLAIAIMGRVCNL